VSFSAARRVPANVDVEAPLWLLDPNATDADSGRRSPRC
jgi:hypothetical protein